MTLSVEYGEGDNLPSLVSHFMKQFVGIMNKKCVKKEVIKL